MHDIDTKQRMGKAYWGASRKAAVDAYKREVYPIDPDMAWTVRPTPAFDSFKVESYCAIVDGDKSLQISAYTDHFAGTAWVAIRENEPSLLLDVHVRVADRDQKIGTAMILEAMYWAVQDRKELHLHVERANKAAQNLYERLGWLEAYTDEDNVWYAAPSKPPLPEEVAPEAVNPIIRPDD